MKDELNPDHPVTKALHGNWHKIVYLIMRKYRLKPVFTEAEIEKFFSGPEMAVVLRDANNELSVEIVTMEEGERLAREVGGVPD